MPATITFTPTPTPSPTPTPGVFDIGSQGGGFFTGVDIANDGTPVFRTDTYGSYVHHTGRLHQLFTTDTMPASEYEPFLFDASGVTDNPGGFGNAIAPTDSNYICSGWRGRYYFWTNKGAGEPTVGNLANKRMLTNTGPQRLWNPVIKYSPVNKNHLLLGTSNDGVYWTKDHGATITAVAGTWSTPDLDVYPNTPLIVGFLSDGTGLIFRQGYGLYKASGTDLATATWALIDPGTIVTDSPYWVSDLHIAADDTILACAPFHGNVIFKCVGETWSRVETPQVAHSVCSDPADPDHLLFCDGDGFTRRSTDGGASWAGPWYHQNADPSVAPGVTMSVTNDVEWHFNHRIFPSQFRFSPLNSHVWMAHGIGAAECSSIPTTTAQTFPYQARSLGARQLIISHFLSVPGKDGFFQFGWDMGTFKYTSADPGDTASLPIHKPGKAFDHNWHADFALDNHDFIAVAAGTRDGGNPDANGYYYTDDFNVTQNALFPGGWPGGDGASARGGCIAVSEEDNIIVVAGGASAYYTKNGGTDWDPTPIGLQGAGQNGRRICVASDKERPGVFGAIVAAGATGGQGFHLTEDGGDTWDQKISGQLNGDPNDSGVGKLVSVPGRSGDWLYCVGGEQAGSLKYYTGDGTTAANLGGASIGSVWCMSCGYNNGAAYPALYWWGHVDGVLGLYYSLDWLATAPVFVTAWPGNWLSYNVTAVGADINVFGRVFVGHGDAGSVWYDLDL